jgi:asparagine synthase (glutamine-hydrolysing)
MVGGAGRVSGICGVCTFDAPASAQTVHDMAAAAPHRGDPHAARFAGAALAQLANAATASRPYVNTEVVVVADARIDNRADLRRALRDRLDANLEEPADAALVAAAYAEWGSACAARIIGDFAFALWDRTARRVVMARDPMGMRSLYYRHEPRHRLLFATEVKQLLVVADVPRRINEAAVAADMVANFGAPSWSFYDGIDQLPPGHVLEVDDGGARLRRFWDVDGSVRLDVGFDEAADLLQRTFADAVACRLDRGRPTGVLLSGGVDSGSVASTAGWLSRSGAADHPPVHALSWAFEDLRECDERFVSRLITDAYGLPVTDVPADAAGPLADYPAHLPDRDDPFLGAFQPLIEHSLAAAAEAGLQVVLGGDRGDLLIGDTGLSYLRMLQAGRGRELRGEVAEHRRALGDSVAFIARRHFVGAVAGRLGRRSVSEWAAWGVNRGKRLAGASPAAEPVHPPWLRAAVLKGAGADALAPAVSPAGLGFARAERYRTIFTPLHLRGIAWSERTYARFGLGFADPFSDRRMAALCVALPQALVNRPGDQSKPLMRAAMKGVIPEPARLRADKIVPTPLYHRGLRQRQGLISELLREPQVEVHGWVDAALMRSHFEAWLNGGALRPEFWWTLQVELWLRSYWT